MFIGAAQHDTRTSSADKLAGLKVFGQKEAVLKAGENVIMTLCVRDRQRVTRNRGNAAAQCDILRIFQTQAVRLNVTLSLWHYANHFSLSESGAAAQLLRT